MPPAKDVNIAQDTAGDLPLSDMTAPPGFSMPIYANQMHTTCLGLQIDEVVHNLEEEVNQPIQLDEEALLGKEGAHIWKKHFAPSPSSTKVIQVPT